MEQHWYPIVDLEGQRAARALVASEADGSYRFAQSFARELAQASEPTLMPVVAEQVVVRGLDVTAVGEEAVVARTARALEEVVVGKSVEQRSKTVNETVRRKDVKVDRIPSSQDPKR